MRTSFVYSVVALCLVACGEPAASPSATPPPSATPITAFYSGPSLGGDSSPLSQACTVASGCVESEASPILLDPAARPLTPHAFDGVTFGIPEGYAPLVLREEILVTALSAETLGGYTFSLRRVGEAETLTGGKPFRTEAGLAGMWAKTGADSAHAYLSAPDGQIWGVEAFTGLGYWGAFEATFVAMLASLRF